MEIHTITVKVLGESASWKTAVCDWDLRFQRGRSVEDDPRIAFPKSASTAEIIEQALDVIISGKQTGLQKKKKILFHQDNVRPDTSALAMGKLHELKYKLIEHPPHSPELAPSDYYLFRNLKQFFRGKVFRRMKDL